MAQAEQAIQEKGYAHPEALVTTEWVAQHLDDTENVRIAESDVLLYDVGHIPNAFKIDWVEDLNDPLMRDYLDPKHFANLMNEKGISPETTVAFYGDKNNWWATYALWVFRLFGHDNVRGMDGGRVKWKARAGSRLRGFPPSRKPTTPRPGETTSRRLCYETNPPAATAVPGSHRYTGNGRSIHHEVHGRYADRHGHRGDRHDNNAA